MNGKELKAARTKKKWTQEQAALALDVTQAYLSMMENGHRPLSHSLVRKAHRVLNLPPTALPLPEQPAALRDTPKSDFSAELGSLGYPGFAYLRTKARRNPAQVLLDALNHPHLDARVAEALPWLVLTYIEMDWSWLVRNAKLQDRQNRLAFAVTLAREVAEIKSDRVREQLMAQRLEALEIARLAREDTFCHDSISQAERVWLRQHRSPIAKHWNLLTDMRGEHIAAAFP